jgi:hypothetical protein
VPQNSYPPETVFPRRCRSSSVPRRSSKRRSNTRPHHAASAA